MSMLTSNPDAAIQLAHRMIADRVDDAHSRSMGRAVHRQRRSLRRAVSEGPTGSEAVSHHAWTSWVTRLAH